MGKKDRYQSCQLFRHPEKLQKFFCVYLFTLRKMDGSFLKSSESFLFSYMKFNSESRNYRNWLSD